MKPRLTRKMLTPEQADQRIQNCFQAISMHCDNINSWLPKIGKPLEWIDMFILGADEPKMKSAQEFIEMSQKEIEKLQWKIYNDYGRFIKVKNKLF